MVRYGIFTSAISVLTWSARKKYTLPVKLRARYLFTVPDSTSQKFMLVGQLSRQDTPSDDRRWTVVHLDFEQTRSRKCEDSDFDTWYARSQGHDCLMGHKQYYRRRKPDANCYVGNKFEDPVEHEEICPCTDEDYEWCVSKISKYVCGALTMLQ